MAAAIPVLIARSRPASVQRTVTPSVWPVALDDAKRQIRISSDDEDTLIQGYIEAATEYCQQYQWAQYITASFAQRSDFFPPSIAPITLYRAPLDLSVNQVVIQYLDPSGNTQTFSSTLYKVDPYIVPPLIVPAYGQFWPVPRWHINDVTVTYDAGYGATASTVPAPIRQAIMMLVSHWFWNREASGTAMGQVEYSVKALLDLNGYRTFI